MVFWHRPHDATQQAEHMPLSLCRWPFTGLQARHCAAGRAQGRNLGSAARYASDGVAASALPASAAGLGAAAGEAEELPSSGLGPPAVGGFSPGCSRAPVSSAGLAMAHSCGAAGGKRRRLDQCAPPTKDDERRHA